MNRDKITIGLVGFGCVGFGLYEVLQQTPGLNVAIKTICVKHREKSRQIATHHFCYDKNELLNDPSIQVIVELIDDSEAAFEIVSEALKRGKSVVTANKKMIAEHFGELLRLQTEYGAALLYEAACCASIPIIRNLEEYYDNDLLESVEGIVNGSTNYILSKTGLAGISYPQALKQAQEMGYAETNPELDTKGFDARYKLVLLLAHAFGLVVEPNKVFNLGIDFLQEPELAYAREHQFKIKLVASAGKTPDGKIKAYVLPKFIKPEDKLFNVDDVFNGIKTRSAFSDAQFFSGKGAGARPTASAVISDISALSYDYRYGYKKLAPHVQLEEETNVLLKVFLRCNTRPDELTRHFEVVEVIHTSRQAGYIIGVIQLAGLRKLFERGGQGLSCVLFDEVSTAEMGPAWAGVETGLLAY